jgi:hypothetical protein
MAINLKKEDIMETVVDKVKEGDFCDLPIADTCVYCGEPDVLDFNNRLCDCVVEIDKGGMLLVDIEYEEGSVELNKEFHCEQHAIEFANRNFSERPRLGYILQAIKWDHVFHDTF